MADDSSKNVGQDEIEELLKQAKAAKPAPAAPAPEGLGVSPGELDALRGSASKPAASKGASDEDATKIMGQADIEAMFQSRPAAAVAKPVAAPPAPAPALAAISDSGLMPADVELLLAQAEQALASIDEPTVSAHRAAVPFKLPEWGGAPASTEVATIELIRDVELDLRIELGRTHMHLEEVLALRKGSVVSLDRSAGDPVDIFVNGRLIARGEVLVLNDNFCVRVAELIAGEKAQAG